MDSCRRSNTGKEGVRSAALAHSCTARRPCNLLHERRFPQPRFGRPAGGPGDTGGQWAEAAAAGRGNSSSSMTETWPGAISATNLSMAGNSPWSKSTSTACSHGPRRQKSGSGEATEGESPRGFQATGGGVHPRPAPRRTSPHMRGLRRWPPSWTME
jgi:hypothetical protein